MFRMMLGLVTLGLTACSSTPSPQAASSQGPAAPVPDPFCAQLLTQMGKDTNLRDLHRRLRAMKLAKGEFETTEAYNQRRDLLLSKPDVGPWVVATAPIYPFRVRYNADTEELSIEPTPDKGIVRFEIGYTRGMEYGRGVDLPRSMSLIMTESSRREAGSYVGTNAFGVSKQVTRVEGDQWGLALHRNVAASATWNTLYSPMLLRANPDNARRLKERLGLMILGELVDPYAWEGYESHSPTISTPLDVSRGLHYVVVRPKCAAIISRDTREVLRHLL